MCGRFSSHHSPEEIMERFEIEEALFQPDPRYNIAPTQLVAAIIEQQGKRQLTGFRWGLVPSWSKDPAIGNRMINARAETILDKPSFKPLLTRRRCLIPADGFYEWKKSTAGSQPFHIRRQDGGLFAFAGLWEEWQSPDGSPLQTCTIITVEPNELMAPIHNRMPAILERADERLWLDAASKDALALTRLLRPHSPDDFEAFPVSRAVNSPSSDAPSLIEKT